MDTFDKILLSKYDGRHKILITESCHVWEDVSFLISQGFHVIGGSEESGTIYYI